MDNLPQHTSDVFLLRPMVGFYSGVDIKGMLAFQPLLYVNYSSRVVKPVNRDDAGKRTPNNLNLLVNMKLTSPSFD